jgi:hypothetical protein
LKANFNEKSGGEPFPPLTIKKKDVYVLGWKITRSAQLSSVTATIGYSEEKSPHLTRNPTSLICSYMLVLSYFHDGHPSSILDPT